MTCRLRRARACALCIILAAAASAVAQTAAAAQATGQIRGTVVTAKGGGAVSGVTVVASRLAPPLAGSFRATSATGGTFTISALPDGVYALCVVDPTGTFANSCEFPDLPVTAKITAGGVAGPVVVPVKQASTLHIRLNDLSSLLSATAGGLPPHVLLGVRDARNVFHPALRVAKDSTGFNYAVSIPFDTALRLHIQSKVLALQGANNSPVPTAGYEATFRHDSSKTPDQQVSFTFSVAGKN